MALDWQSLLASIASVAIAVLLSRNGFFKGASTSFALIAVWVTAAGYIFDFMTAFAGLQSPITLNISDFAWLLVAALLLVSLANFLREDKPPFARYPFFFTLLPLIVLPVYPFIADTVVIKNWVLALYQFGALVIAGLLFSLMSAKDKSNRVIVLSVALFTLAWLAKWIVDFQSADRWIYTICIILGMILATKTFYESKPSTSTQ
jgi:hypothetical protein